jgi:TetR/AcrR family transcriptional regulator, cholesterol catabolism regulator
MRAGTTVLPSERRGFILERAAELFSRLGYHATSMRDIAEATGLRAPSLYAHIDGKEDLLYEIVTAAAAQFLGGLESVRASRRVPEEMLRQAMRAHVRVVADNLEGARVFHHEWRALNPDRRREIEALRDRYDSLWAEVIRAVRPRDPKFARLLALSAANWTYVWYDPAGPLSPEQVADRFTDLVLSGIRGPGAGNNRKRGAAR